VSGIVRLPEWLIGDEIGIGKSFDLAHGSQGIHSPDLIAGRQFF
jgi:hypothetical protein